MRHTLAALLLVALTSSAFAQAPTTPTSLWIGISRGDAFGLELGARAKFFGLSVFSPQLERDDTTSLSLGLSSHFFVDFSDRTAAYATIGAAYYRGPRTDGWINNDFVYGVGVEQRIADAFVVGAGYTNVQGVVIRFGWHQDVQ